MTEQFSPPERTPDEYRELLAEKVSQARQAVQDLKAAQSQVFASEQPKVWTDLGAVSRILDDATTRAEKYLGLEDEQPAVDQAESPAA